MPQPQPPPPTLAVTAPPSAILLRASHHLLAQHLWRQPPTTPRATVFYAVSSPSITLPPPLRAPRNSSDHQPVHHTKPHRLRSRVAGTTTALVCLHHASSSPFGHAARTSIDVTGLFNISGNTCTNTSASSRVICLTPCQNRSSSSRIEPPPLHQAQHFHGSATIEVMEATASSPWKPPRVRHEPRRKYILCHRKPITAARHHEETLTMEGLTRKP